MKPQTESGYTILEMLIATTILSAVLSVGFYAYQMLSSTLTANFKQFDRAFERARLLITMQELLESIRPLVVATGDDQTGIYFEGTNTGFITAAYPAQESPALEILRLAGIDEGAGEGPALTLERAQMQTLALESFQQRIPFPAAETLARCETPPRFSYRGWSSSDAMFRALERSSRFTERPEWRDGYNGLVTGLLPEAIAVELACGFDPVRIEVVLSDADLIAISVSDTDL
jgi:type II secretory pathway pseudopilin PulG